MNVSGLLKHDRAGAESIAFTSKSVKFVICFRALLFVWYSQMFAMPSRSE